MDIHGKSKDILDGYPRNQEEASRLFAALAASEGDEDGSGDGGEGDSEDASASVDSKSILPPPPPQLLLQSASCVCCLLLITSLYVTVQYPQPLT